MKNQTDVVPASFARESVPAPRPRLYHARNAENAVGLIFLFYSADNPGPIRSDPRVLFSGAWPPRPKGPSEPRHNPKTKFIAGARLRAFFF
ncbi:MAG: hypothetical protein LBJ73_02710 [Rickettsiales bacterium]|nr:hypothetical protein [Rickettsiales bacterium]